MSAWAAAALHPTTCLPRVCDGSSLLARGTLYLVVDRAGDDRIIPARAGNTRLRRRPPARRPDHPRSRGEHSTPKESPILDVGSSPLARGTRYHHGQVQGRPRIIPARAGNTRCWPWSGTTRPDHPRSRGEHAPIRYPAKRASGSSPLARGTPHQSNSRENDFRIIPARAGNTV